MDVDDEGGVDDREQAQRKGGSWRERMSDDEVLVVLLDVARTVSGCFSLVHRVEVDAWIVGPDELEKLWEHLQIHIPSVPNQRSASTVPF